MSFLRLFRLSALSVGFSALLVWAAAERSLLAPGLFVFLLAAGEAARRRGRHVRLSLDRKGAWAWGGAAAAALLLAAVEGPGVAAAGHAAGLLLCLRLQGARLPLHYAQGLFLGLAVVFLSCFLPPSFLTFPALAYVGFFAVFHLLLLDTFARRFAFLVQGRKGHLDAGALTYQVDAPFARLSEVRRLGLFAAAACLHVLVTAALLFVLAPRLWSEGGAAPDRAGAPDEAAAPDRGGAGPSDILRQLSRAGGPARYRERVDLSRDRRGEGSDRRVVAIRFFRGARRVPPPSLDLYLKGAVLDRFDGRTWSRTETRIRAVRDRDDGARDGRVFLGRSLPDWDGSLRLEVWLKADLGDRRFWMEELEGVSARRAEVGADGSLRGSSPVHREAASFAYTVFVTPSRFCPFDDRDTLERYLGLHPGAERFRDLARVLSRGATSPLARARALRASLEKSYRYASSFETGGPQPLEDFLLRTRTGNCEYFATALTVLLRLLGVPARLVVGYYGGAYGHDGEETYLLVRESNAHAWTEVLDSSQGGWVRVDATPVLCRPGAAAEEAGELFEDVEAPEPPPEEPRSLLGRIEGFDGAAQRRMLSRGARFAGSLASGAAGLAGSLFSDYFLITMPVLLVAVLFVVLRFTRPDILRRRSWVPEGFEDARRDSTYAFYVAFLKALSNLGFHKKAAMTPREFARAVGRRRRDLSEDVGFVTEVFHQARYRGREPGRTELGRIRSIVRSLRRSGAAGA